MRLLLFLFILIPLAEMLLLFEVSDHIGALNTLGLVVLTAIIGIAILRQQGLSTLLRANERLNSGEIPAQEILEGLFLAAGGAFLLTPGFITDSVGFICLIGPSRRFVVRQLIRSGGLVMMGFGGVQGFHYGDRGRGDGPAAGADVYEGEFSKESGADKRLDDGSGRRPPPGGSSK
ncbi:MAG: FxsA family protein [Pseudomonadales bacterium]|nr:FxsA family protein [Pseudomonadales bacterium]